MQFFDHYVVVATTLHVSKVFTCCLSPSLANYFVTTSINRGDKSPTVSCSALARDILPVLLVILA